MPNLSIEKKYEGKIVCGVDEVGRGCLAGDVYASAVILPEDFPSEVLEQLQDSKKLTAKRREELYTQIKEHAICATGIISVEEIDKINILQAAMKAMKHAVKKLDITPDVCLIDGNRSPELDDYEVETVVKGDGKSCSIAAASIVAKVERDAMMKELSNRFAYYGWDKNAGYGTKAHLRALEAHGYCELHRKSFAPIKDML